MGKLPSVGLVTVCGVLQGAHAGPVSHAEPAFSLSIPDGFALAEAEPNAKELGFHHGGDLITVDWYASDRAPDPVDPATFAAYHELDPLP